MEILHPYFVNISCSFIDSAFLSDNFIPIIVGIVKSPSLKDLSKACIFQLSGQLYSIM